MSSETITPLAPDVAGILAAARDLPPPSCDVERRVRARVALTLGVVGTAATGAAGAGAVAGAPAVAGASATAAKPLWLALTAMAVAAGVGTTYLVLRNASTTPGMAVAADAAPPADAALAHTPPPAPVASDAGLAREQATPEQAPEPDAPAPGDAAAGAKRPRSRRADATEPDPPAPADGLAAERALLDPARAALAKGRALQALDHLEEHRRRFRQGQLAEEREALTVRALIRAGRLHKARDFAARFRRLYPDSLYSRAIDAAFEQAGLTDSDGTSQ